jgi:hypothetical protein
MTTEYLDDEDQQEANTKNGQDQIGHGAPAQGNDNSNGTTRVMGSSPTVMVAMAIKGRCSTLMSP